MAQTPEAELPDPDYLGDCDRILRKINDRSANAPSDDTKRSLRDRYDRHIRMAEVQQLQRIANALDRIASHTARFNV